MYWSVGTLYKWNNHLYSSLDVSQTHWSDFSFKAEGEERINPLTGGPYDEDQIDDCWSMRFGTEYLWLLEKTEIPFRAGVGWDQQPAVGRPDEYWSVSVGTGVAIGKRNVKCVFDLAYSYQWGSDVLGSLLPTEDAVTTDVEVHQVFLSNIWHF